MNTIDFRATKSDLGLAEVTVLLDGREISDHEFDPAGLLFGADYEAVSFHLFSCSCGVPGCSGFDEPIEHRRTPGAIVWSVPDEKLSGLLGGTSFRFDPMAFDAARARLLADLQALGDEGFFLTLTLVDAAHNDDPSSLKGLPGQALRARAYFEAENAINQAIAAHPRGLDPVEYCWADDQPTGLVLACDFYPCPLGEIASTIAIDHFDRANTASPEALKRLHDTISALAHLIDTGDRASLEEARAQAPENPPRVEIQSRQDRPRIIFFD